MYVKLSGLKMRSTWRRHAHGCRVTMILKMGSFWLDLLNEWFSFSLMLLIGISLKTQELYAIVFLARYLDLFTDYISFYNTVMKLVFIGSSLAIVWCMRMHWAVKRSYDKELDTFRHYFLILASFVLALLVHEKFTFQEVISFPSTYFICNFSIW